MKLRRQNLLWIGLIKERWNLSLFFVFGWIDIWLFVLQFVWYRINKMTDLVIDVSALPSTQLSNEVLCVRSRMDKTYFFIYIVFIILVNMECKSHRALYRNLARRNRIIHFMNTSWNESVLTLVVRFWILNPVHT